MDKRQDIDHGVDRTGPAQQFPARPEIRTPTQALAGLGRVAPVYGLVIEQLAIAQRDGDPKSPVCTPRFQQADSIATIR